jgi:hypothetical protein
VYCWFLIFLSFPVWVMIPVNIVWVVLGVYWMSNWMSNLFFLIIFFLIFYSACIEWEYN